MEQQRDGAFNAICLLHMIFWHYSPTDLTSHTFSNVKFPISRIGLCNRVVPQTSHLPSCSRTTNSFVLALSTFPRGAIAKSLSWESSQSRDNLPSSVLFLPSSCLFSHSGIRLEEQTLEPTPWRILGVQGQHWVTIALLAWKTASVDPKCDNWNPWDLYGVEGWKHWSVPGTTVYTCPNWRELLWRKGRCSGWNTAPEAKLTQDIEQEQLGWRI